MPGPIQRPGSQLQNTGTNLPGLLAAWIAHQGRTALLGTGQPRPLVTSQGYVLGGGGQDVGILGGLGQMFDPRHPEGLANIAAMFAGRPGGVAGYGGKNYEILGSEAERARQIQINQALRTRRARQKLGTMGFRPFRRPGMPPKRASVQIGRDYNLNSALISQGGVPGFISDTATPGIPDLPFSNREILSQLFDLNQKLSGKYSQQVMNEAVLRKIFNDQGLYYGRRPTN